MAFRDPNLSNFLKEAASMNKSVWELRTPIVERWDKTRLLEGITNTEERYTLAQLLQNQANQILRESSRTGTAYGNEEWNGIALPTVRKVFVDQMAKKFVHTQALERASGLVFFLDFDLEHSVPAGNSYYTANESVYGDTMNATGGLYGADRFAYATNYFSASATVASTGSATWSEVGFHSLLSASAAANQLWKITIPSSSLDSPDMYALASFTFYSASVEPVVLRRYTTRDINTGDITFIVSGSTGGVEAADVVTVEYTKQTTAGDRGDYEQGQAGVGPIRGIDIKWSQREVVAKTKKLRFHITPELIQDLEDYQAVDAQKLLSEMITMWVNQEIDTEILNMLSHAASDSGNVAYWSAKVGADTNSRTGAYLANPASFYMGPTEWYKTLGIRIRSVSNEINARTLMGGATFAVVSPKVATIVEQMQGFNSSTDSAGNSFTVGNEATGTLNNSIKVYVNPYWSQHRENEILMGLRGSNFSQTGAAFCTHTPIMMTPPLTDPDDFTIKQGLMTRNAKIVYRPEFYAKIFVRDLDTV